MLPLCFQGSGGEGTPWLRGGHLGYEGTPWLRGDTLVTSYWDHISGPDPSKWTQITGGLVCLALFAIHGAGGPWHWHSFSESSKYTLGYL